MQMKIFLKYAPAIFLLVSMTNIDAQIKSGYIIGLNLSTMSMNTIDKSYDQKTITGIHFGRFIVLPVKGNFTFQPGLLFSSKGSSYKIDTVRYSITPIYIEISALAAYNFGPENYKISLFGGPYLACGISGRLDSDAETRTISFGSSDNDDLKLFDAGLDFGGGIIYKRVMLSARYEFGLTNLSPVKTDDYEIKNKVTEISLTYMLKGKK